MNKERLLKLADFLEKLPPERFNFNNYVGYNWEGDLDLKCGTTACAIGWAATIPEFKELGLILQPIKLKNNIQADGWYLSIKAQEIFEITDREYTFLFIPGILHNNSTAKEVVDHIRKFCDKGGRW